MVAYTVGLLAALTATASAQYGYEYQNTDTSSSKAVYETTTLSSYSAPAVYPTTSSADAYPTASTSAPKDCEKVRSDCQSKPDANQSTCAALYVQCSGTTSGLNKPDAYPTASPSAPKDCEKVRSDCQSKPDANQSTCAALFAECAGTTSGLNKPAPYPTSSAPAPKDCEKVRSDCQSKPDANQSYCASLYVQCAGTTSGLNKPPAETTVEYTVYTTVCPATSVYTSGVQTYTSVYTTTSTITSCKGGCPTTYAPAPTTSAIDACQDKFDKCRNGEDGGDRNQSRCASEFATCKAGPSYPTASKETTAPAPSSTPVDACQDKFDKCRNGEDGGDRNQSRCASEFATCKAGPSYPTASKETAAPAPSSTPVDVCQDKFNKCRNGEDGGDRNQARCASEFSACQSASTTAPAQTYPAGVPAQTYTPTTLASYTPVVVGTASAPNATASTIQYTGAASSLKAGLVGLSGVLALALLL